MVECDPKIIEWIVFAVFTVFSFAGLAVGLTVLKNDLENDDGGR